MSLTERHGQRCPAGRTRRDLGSTDRRSPGVSMSADQNTCERCRGRGFVVRDRAHDVTPTCPTCNGTGRTDPKAECCHGLDDLCVSSGCLMGIVGGEYS